MQNTFKKTPLTHVEKDRTKDLKTPQNSTLGTKTFSFKETNPFITKSGIHTTDLIKQDPQTDKLETQFNNLKTRLAQAQQTYDPRSTMQKLLGLDQGQGLVSGTLDLLSRPLYTVKAAADYTLNPDNSPYANIGDAIWTGGIRGGARNSTWTDIFGLNNAKLDGFSSFIINFGLDMYADPINIMPPGSIMEAMKYAGKTTGKALDTVLKSVMGDEHYNKIRQAFVDFGNGFGRRFLPGFGMNEEFRKQVAGIRNTAISSERQLFELIPAMNDSIQKVSRGLEKYVRTGEVDANDLDYIIKFAHENNRDKKEVIEEQLKALGLGDYKKDAEKWALKNKGAAEAMDLPENKFEYWTSDPDRIRDAHTYLRTNVPDYARLSQKEGELTHDTFEKLLREHLDEIHDFHISQRERLLNASNRSDMIYNAVGNAFTSQLREGHGTGEFIRRTVNNLLQAAGNTDGMYIATNSVEEAAQTAADILTVFTGHQRTADEILSKMLITNEDEGIRAIRKEYDDRIAETRHNEQEDYLNAQDAQNQYSEILRSKFQDDVKKQVEGLSSKEYRNKKREEKELTNQEVHLSQQIAKEAENVQNVLNVPTFEDYAREQGMDTDALTASYLFNPRTERSELDKHLTGFNSAWLHWNEDPEFRENYIYAVRKTNEKEKGYLSMIVSGDKDKAKTGLGKFRAKLAKKIYGVDDFSTLTREQMGVLGDYVEFHQKMMTFVAPYAAGETQIQYFLRMVNSENMSEQIDQFLFRRAAAGFDWAKTSGENSALWFQEHFNNWHNGFNNTTQYDANAAHAYVKMVEDQRKLYQNDPLFRFWSELKGRQNDAIAQILEDKTSKVRVLAPELVHLRDNLKNASSMDEFIDLITKDDYDFGTFRSEGENIRDKLLSARQENITPDTVNTTYTEEPTEEFRYLNKKGEEVTNSLSEEQLLKNYRKWDKVGTKVTNDDILGGIKRLKIDVEDDKLDVQNYEIDIKDFTKERKQLLDDLKTGDLLLEDIIPTKNRIAELDLQIALRNKKIAKIEAKYPTYQERYNRYATREQENYLKDLEEKVQKGTLTKEPILKKVEHTETIPGGKVKNYELNLRAIASKELQKILSDRRSYTEFAVGEKLRKLVRDRENAQNARTAIRFSMSNEDAILNNWVKNDPHFKELHEKTIDAYKAYQKKVENLREEKRLAVLEYAKAHGGKYDMSKLENSDFPFLFIKTKNRKFNQFDQLQKNAGGGIPTGALQSVVLAGEGDGITFMLNPNHEWFSEREAEKGIYAEMAQGIEREVYEQAEKEALSELAGNGVSPEILWARTELATGDYQNYEDAFVNTTGEELNLKTFKDYATPEELKELERKTRIHLEDHLRQTVQLPQNIQTPKAILVPETFISQWKVFNIEIVEFAARQGIDREALLNSVTLKNVRNPQEGTLLSQIDTLRYRSTSSALQTENGTKARFKGQSSNKYSARYGLYMDSINNHLSGFDYFSNNAVWTAAQQLRMQEEEFSFFKIVESAFKTGSIRKVDLAEAVNLVGKGVRKNPNIGRTYIEGKELRDKMYNYVHLVPQEEFEKTMDLLEPLLESGDKDTFEIPIGMWDMISRPAQTETVGNSITNLIGGFIKNWKTTLLFTPGYHLRNVISNFANAWTAGINPGEYTIEYNKALADLGELHQQVRRATRLQAEHLEKYNFSGDQNEYKKFWKEVVCENDDGRFNLWNDYLELTRRGVVNQTKVSSDFFDMSADIAKLSRKKNWLSKELENVLNTNVRFGQITDDAARLAAHRIVSRNPEIVERMGLKDADSFIRTVFFDFNAMTEFEKTTMRKLIPFYTWMKKNLEFQIKALMNNPGRLTRFSKAINALYNAQDIDPTQVPEWVTDQMYIPVRNGDKLRLMKFSLPVLDFIEIGNLKLLSRGNPFLKTIFETMTGTDLFTQQNTNMWKSGYTNLLKPFTRLLAAPFDIPVGQMPIGGGKTLGGLVGQDYDLISKNSFYFTESVTKLRRSFLWEQINTYQDYITMLQNQGIFIPTMTQLTNQATNPRFDIPDPIGTYNIQKIRVPK